MNATVTIGRQTVPIVATAGVIVLYNSQFGTEYLEDYLSLKEETNIEKYLMVGYRLLWCMAKTADPRLLPPDEWILALGDFDLEQPLKIAQKLFTDTMKRCRNDGDVDGEPLTADRLIAYAAICGMTMSDLDRLSLPLVINSIDSYITAKYGSDESKEASQADYDNF